MNTLFMIVLLILAIGLFPAWPYSLNWGYYPSGGLGLLLVVAIIVALSNRRVI